MLPASSGRAEDHDVGLGVRGHEATGRLGARGHGALRPDEDDVGALAGVAGEQLVGGGDAVDALDAGDRGHDTRQSLADTAPVVADQNRPHTDSVRDGETARGWALSLSSVTPPGRLTPE